MTKSGNSYTVAWRILLLALFSFQTVIVVGQSPAETLNFAREQFKAGNYSMANKALNRLMFFDNGIEHPETFELLADSYFHLNDYSNAWNFYDLASIRTDHDSSRAEFTAMKAACRLYDKLYNEALMDLMSFQGELTSDQQWQFDLLAGISTFYLDDYETAKSYLLKCADITSSPIIDSGFVAIGHLEKRYNPKLARVMSIIFPEADKYTPEILKTASILLAWYLVLLPSLQGFQHLYIFLMQPLLFFPGFSDTIWAAIKKPTPSPSINKKPERTRCSPICWLYFQHRKANENADLQHRSPLVSSDFYFDGYIHRESAKSVFNFRKC